MAEGGSEDNKNPDKNPFSFKSYVQNKSSKRSGNSDDLNDQDGKASNDVAKTTLHRQTDENPFSFRKFLSSQNGPRVASSSTLSGQSSGHIKTLDLANDLPDFVHDHNGANASGFEESGSVRRDTYHNKSVLLPDFALDVDIVTDGHFLGGDIQNSQLPYSFNRLHGSLWASHDILPDAPDDSVNLSNGLNSGLHSSLTENGSRDIVEASAAIVEPDLQPLCAHVCELPDFLPIGALNGHVDVDEYSDEGSLSLSNLRTMVTQLRAENNRLQSQLTEARRSSLAELRSENAQLQRDLISQRQREQEDTEALANMVKQVEANLATAVARAVKAEKTIVKLQDELHTAQMRNRQLEHENSLLAGGDNAIRPMKEKAVYASQQIAFAARNAEELLRQLLKGVDGLKMISDVLASIDKVTTKEDCDNNDEADGASSGS